MWTVRLRRLAISSPPTNLPDSDWIGHFVAQGTLVVGDESGSTDLATTRLQRSVDERGSGSWVEIEGASTWSSPPRPTTHHERALQAAPP